MQLTILRSCNELLRRLSRARDTTFCGRVFIFMFQSFPLGDRSSVNLRGEYHVENITTFDLEPAANDTSEKMQIDAEVAGTPSPDAKPAEVKSSSSDQCMARSRKDMDALYPVFWSLQASFSQPKKLFDRRHFENFKSSLESTLSTFKDAQTKQLSRSQKQEDDSRMGQKRKRESEGDDLADAFIPKYLTSRDLFELELSDLTFRRYVLVQALIIMEFLLSLSAEERAISAVAGAPNKSVVYSDQQLEAEDVGWVKKTRSEILTQLEYSGSNSNEGMYFVRIVKTILARDKNWVRWKLHACSPIETQPLAPQIFVEAKQSACRSATSRKLRATPMNALSIDFLDTNRDASGLDKFKSKGRSHVPDANTFKQAIVEDELEIDLPTNNQSKSAAIEGKASKTWRALRITSRSRLAVFDKIEDPDKVDIIFEDASRPHLDGTTILSLRERPNDSRPLIIYGPAAVGKSSLIQLLLDRIPGIFGRVSTHTTKPPEDDGKASISSGHITVDSSSFSTMIDGDQFLEYSTVDGNQYGTSRREAESVSKSGKIPLMEMSVDGARQSKETSYAARYILVKPSDFASLQTRLEGRGIAADKAAEIVAAAKEDLEHVEPAGGCDEVVISGDLEAAYEALGRIIYSYERRDQAQKP